MELAVDAGASQAFNFLECSADDSVVFAVSGDGTLKVSSLALALKHTVLW
jgi:hypothetical protein